MVFIKSAYLHFGKHTINCTKRVMLSTFVWVILSFCSQKCFLRSLFYLFLLRNNIFQACELFSLSIRDRVKLECMNLKGMQVCLVQVKAFSRINDDCRCNVIPRYFHFGTTNLSNLFSFCCLDSTLSKGAGVGVLSDICGCMGVFMFVHAGQ